MKPVVRERRCNGCGICKDVCPLGAISVRDGGTGTGGVNGRVLIDRGRCLNCYLCHYRCPRKAIALRGIWYAPALYAIRRIMRI